MCAGGGGGGGETVPHLPMDLPLRYIFVKRISRMGP